MTSLMLAIRGMFEALGLKEGPEQFLASLVLLAFAILTAFFVRSYFGRPKKRRR